MTEAATIALTDFHNRPGEVIDRSQAGPVRLTKRNRPFAFVVSADWFERAERALEELHGRRRVLDAQSLDPADRAFIMANGPDDEEVRTDAWRS